MNRRGFLALASGLLVPEPQRVYSFLWANPLADSFASPLPPVEFSVVIPVQQCERRILHVDDLAPDLRAMLLETSYVLPPRPPEVPV